MKKRIYAIFFSALLMCSCGSDKEPENTEPTDSFTTTLVESPQEPEPTNPVYEDNEDIAVTNRSFASVPDNAVLIDSINDTDANIGLYFIGSIHDSFYSGTLAVRSQSKDNEDIYNIFENESFTLLPPEKAENDTQTSENGFLRRESPELLSFKRIVSGQTRVRLFELESDTKIIPITIIPDEDYSHIIINSEEFIAGDFRWSANMYMDYRNYEERKNSNDCAMGCCDYGENEYTEFTVDLKTDRVQISGSVAYHTDSEITEAVKNAYAAYYFANGHELSFDSSFEQYLTNIDQNDERDEDYYGISPELAQSKEELISLLRRPFTEYGADRAGITEEQLFGGKDPVFSDDKGGLVYIQKYRGVPTGFAYDSVRVISADENTVHAVVSGHTVDQEIMRDMRLVRENGEWKLDEITESDKPLGGYFGSFSVYTDKGPMSITTGFDPFDLYAGEEFTVSMYSSRSDTDLKMAEDISGNKFICRFDKAEDFDSADLSVFDSGSTSDSRPEIKADYTFVIPESGKYIFRAGCRYISDDGKTFDLIIGPQIVHIG